MHEKPVNHVNDEIDLLDIIRQLWQGKVIVFCVSIMFLAIAGLYIMLTTPKWTAESTLSKPYLNQLANYPAGVMLSQVWPMNDGDNAPVIDDAKITGNVFNTFIAMANAQILSGMDISIRPGTTAETFIVSSTANDPALAKKNLQSALMSLSDDARKQLDALMYSSLRERANSLKIQMQAQENSARAQRDYRISVLKNALQLANQMNIQQTKLNPVSGEISDDMLFMLGVPILNTMIEHEKNLPLKFNASYFDMQEMFDSINGFKLTEDNLSIFNATNISVDKVGQKRALIFVLSLLLGMILSCGYILLRNALRSANK
ncbi:LPS O-antigen chain length determinant protein WzzB [Edwardsiella piscicida]|uniref:LPS O-antigen chain length determinant protein WzzB n=1 Tax=Edwardsiella piscicida TaxID=1263550 RepID=UPI00054CCA3D|nr:LPS O-antigen chain length determinant protein WzzB [Edwardsiella piscicida]ELM3657400.1 LPS O-antigen chain length determinant protein WzzB [Edwardsiella piscicida]ELM3734931.1 LPS O-antigen chain length determinant protein WzzB [Edwardsiella piscicida]QBB14072.1 LPS O-antigen chain length determinant protein WzzB [Edwardsiella piscicida]UCQ16179.1 LPS O-antigen chain length determinant protein WzzB [Edwardsiella piscicida]UCQ39376.1 LPS O-antigen chain length determinant protein WzzB [Edw